uniref:Calpain catalytic domain-containing protein n=1 Tax=Globodera rostochiensis TaxID=31243 RepID=A0A914HI65_GLORO
MAKVKTSKSQGSVKARQESNQESGQRRGKSRVRAASRVKSRVKSRDRAKVKARKSQQETRQVKKQCNGSSGRIPAMDASYPAVVEWAHGLLVQKSCEFDAWKVQFERYKCLKNALRTLRDLHPNWQMRRFKIGIGNKNDAPARRTVVFKKADSSCRRGLYSSSYSSPPIQNGRTLTSSQPLYSTPHYVSSTHLQPLSHGTAHSTSRLSRYMTPSPRQDDSLFEDPDFPANNSILYFGSAPIAVQWLRPFDITRRPQFINVDPHAFEAKQGALGDCWLISAVAVLSTRPELFYRVVPPDQSFTDQYAAYAKLYGSYAVIRGGFMRDALVDFTGGITEPINLNPERRPTNLEKGHAYSIMGIRQVTTHYDILLTLLRIRNPWGKEEKWRGAWSDRSELWGSLPSFLAFELRSQTSESNGEFWMSWTKSKKCQIWPIFRAPGTMSRSMGNGIRKQPEEPHHTITWPDGEQAVRLQEKDFPLEHCAKSEKFHKQREDDSLFEDPDFPANNSILYFGSAPIAVQWLRPFDITRRPQFINVDPHAFEAKQGALGDCWLISAVAVLSTRPELFYRVVPPDQSFTDQYAAYAKLYGSYAVIRGGFMRDALVDFTGGITEPINLNPERRPTNLEKGHAYSIMGIRQVTTHYDILLTLLRIRNPWGKEEKWRGAWSDRSELWGSLPSFLAFELRSQTSESNGEFWMSWTKSKKCQIWPIFRAPGTMSRSMGNGIRKQPEEPHHTITWPDGEQAVRLQEKDFPLEHCAKSEKFHKQREDDSLFEDPDFPANNSILYFGSAPIAVQWLRPFDITRRPQFINVDPHAFEAKQGALGDCWLISAVAVLSTRPELFYRVVPPDQSFTDQYAAYAKLYGSYAVIRGGFMRDALVDFTGGITEPINLNPERRPTNLEKGHAYSIMGIRQVTTHYDILLTLLRIRNPWGKEEKWRGAWSDRSELWGSLPSFLAFELRSQTSESNGEFWMSWTKSKKCQIWPIFRAPGTMSRSMGNGIRKQPEEPHHTITWPDGEQAVRLQEKDFPLEHCAKSEKFHKQREKNALRTLRDLHPNWQMRRFKIGIGNKNDAPARRTVVFKKADSSCRRGLYSSSYSSPPIQNGRTLTSSQPLYSTPHYVSSTHLQPLSHGTAHSTSRLSRYMTPSPRQKNALRTLRDLHPNWQMRRFKIGIGNKNDAPARRTVVFKKADSSCRRGLYSSSYSSPPIQNGRTLTSSQPLYSTPHYVSSTHLQPLSHGTAHSTSRLSRYMTPSPRQKNALRTLRDLHPNWQMRRFKIGIGNKNDAPARRTVVFKKADSSCRRGLYSSSYSSPPIQNGRTLTSSQPLYSTPHYVSSTHLQPLSHGTAHSTSRLSRYMTPSPRQFDQYAKPASINLPRGSPLPLRDYQPIEFSVLRSQCLQAMLVVELMCFCDDSLFEDPDFPANNSILYLGSAPIAVQWLRPFDITRRPQFINVDPHAFEAKQGALGDCWLISAVAVLSTRPELFYRVVPPDQSFTDQYAAYAKLYGSYAVIRGGFMRDALVDFTGGITEPINLNPERRPTNLEKDVVDEVQEMSNLAHISSPWDNVTFDGQWNSETAGGATSYNNLENFTRNPQYWINLASEHGGRNTPDGEQAVRLQEKDFPLEHCAKSEKFHKQREVTYRFKLPNGNYVIFPSTYKSGDQGDFMLCIFTN